MFYLSNAAIAILESAREGLVRRLGTPQGASEFGYRFQSLVEGALRLRPGWADLYGNPAAGQPDCYFGEYGFEIKCREQSPVRLDDNTWAAMLNYQFPRVVAMLAVSPPYPVFVIDLHGLAPQPVRLDRGAKFDMDLEQFLKPMLTELIEAVGAAGLSAVERADVIQRIKMCVDSIEPVEVPERE